MISFQFLVSFTEFRCSPYAPSSYPCGGRERLHKSQKTNEKMEKSVAHLGKDQRITKEYTVLQGCQY